MTIFTWCSPRYFPFQYVMLRTLRMHTCEVPVTLLLLDFSEDEIVKAQNIVQTFAPIQIELGFSRDYPQASDLFQFYRNCRVDFFLKALDDNPEDSLITIAANALVRQDISFMYDWLQKYEFVFLQRRNRVLRQVRRLRDFPKFATPEQAVNLQFLARNVLLGTHAMQNTDRVRSVLRRWQELIHTEGNINLMWSDMGNFVRAFLEAEATPGTAPFLIKSSPLVCDCRQGEGTAIWFAKNARKRRNNKTYKDVALPLIAEIKDTWGECPWL